MHFKIAEEDKTNHRYSGVLVHPTSFPSPYGIGDMGQGAYDFIDFLAMSGQHLWQVLPLGPTTVGDSPYQSFSVFAGQPLLISPELLRKKKLLSDEDLREVPDFDPDHVEYEKVQVYKTGLLKKAYASFRHTADKNLLEEYDAFCESNEFWLLDYCLFMAGKDHHNGLPWYEWEDGLKDPSPAERTEWSDILRSDVEYYKFVQFLFYSQWYDLKAYANKKGIAIIGDIPIFPCWDSADVWANKTMFCLDSKGFPLEVAGVPPDYFSATGQLWGNPLYDWKAHKEDHYRWWVERIRNQLDQVDYVRIDHFRGFEAYWAVPYGEETALNGKWKKGPGEDLFLVIQKALDGELPIFAEDLGIITPEVERLREMGCHRGMVSMQGLGYKEILAYLEGEASLEEVVESIKRDTRHFAKRQLTWFRREKDIIWVDKEKFHRDEERILEFMLQELQEKGIIASPQKLQPPSIYLFSGPCGCGKSTLTKAWAKKLVNEGKTDLLNSIEVK